MKKTILIFTLTLLTSLGMAQKYGHLNAQDVLKAMPEYLEAQGEMERYQKQKEKELMTMQQTLQAELKKYEEEVGALSPAVKASREKDLMELQQSIQEFAQKAQEKVVAKEGELLQPMIDDVKLAIKNVGKANGFTYIFDVSAGSVLYFDGGNDVSELVKKEVEKIMKEKKAKSN